MSKTSRETLRSIIGPVVAVLVVVACLGAGLGAAVLAIVLLIVSPKQIATDRPAPNSSTDAVDAIQPSDLNQADTTSPATEASRNSQYAPTSGPRPPTSEPGEAALTRRDAHNSRIKSLPMLLLNAEFESVGVHDGQSHLVLGESLLAFALSSEHVFGQVRIATEPVSSFAYDGSTAWLINHDNNELHYITQRDPRLFESIRAHLVMFPQDILSLLGLRPIPADAEYTLFPASLFSGPLDSWTYQDGNLMFEIRLDSDSNYPVFCSINRVRDDGEEESFGRAVMREYMWIRSENGEKNLFRLPKKVTIDTQFDGFPARARLTLTTVKMNHDGTPPFAMELFSPDEWLDADPRLKTIDYSNSDSGN